MRAAMMFLPLCFAVGCVVDEGDATTTEESSELTTVCTVFRPVQWGSAGNLCVERRGPTVFLQDGEQFETFAVPGPNRGEGFLILGCSATAGLYEVASSCQQ
jgi:hypothetical protein